MRDLIGDIVKVTVDRPMISREIFSIGGCDVICCLKSNDISVTIIGAGGVYNELCC